MAKTQSWQRRQALVLATMLPDHKNDALAVLDACREIVEAFLDPSEDQPSGENVFMLTRKRDL